MTGKQECQLFSFFLLVVHGLSCELGWRGHDGWCYYTSSSSSGTEHSRTDEIPFDGAKDHCRGEEAELVSVHSVEEEEFLAGGLLDQHRPSWVGLTALHGALQWTDTTEFDYPPFGKTSPDASTFRCFVVTLDGDLQRRRVLLQGVDCSARNLFICKKLAPKLRPTLTSTSTVCTNCTKRIKRQIHQDAFLSPFGNPFDRQQPMFGHPNLIWAPSPAPTYQYVSHRGWPTPPPSIHPLFALNQRPSIFHPVNRPSRVIVFPHHQGGAVLHLNSLFSRARDDQSNLIVDDKDSQTTQQPIVVQTAESPQATTPDDEDHQRPGENLETTGVTTPSDAQVSSITTTASSSPNHVSSEPTTSPANRSLSPTGESVASVTQSPNLRRTIRFQLPEPTKSSRMIWAAELTTRNPVHVPGRGPFPYIRAYVPDNRNTPRNGNGCDKDEDLFYGDSCYFLTKRSLSYYDSLNRCVAGRPKGLNPTPVQIDNADENAFLVSSYNHRGHYAWIGLHKKYQRGSVLSYEWIDTEFVPYTNWADNEPAISVGDCVYASGAQGTKGQWFVDKCDAQHTMLCEYPRMGHAPPPPTITRNQPSLPCADGWTLYRPTASCYKLMTHGGLTQSIAELNCVQYGGHLVSITSDEEEGFIRRMPSVTQMSYTTIWTGLVQIQKGEFSWLDGSPTTHLKWRRGQPEYHHGRENCVTAYKHTMELSDSYCDAYFAYMCKAPMGMSSTLLQPITPSPPTPCPGPLGLDGWTMFSEHCYKAYSSSTVGPLTWQRAKAFCRNKGGDLLSLADRDENNYVLSQVYTLPDITMWIGGFAHLDGGYRWSDDTPFTFINWKRGEPNNYRDLESCMSLYPKIEAYWNDDSCGRELGWVCEVAVGSTSPPPATTAKPTGNCPAEWLNTGRKCIKLITEPKEFFEARNICSESGPGADLVSIHDAKDNAYAAILTGPRTRGSWIGLTFNENYIWVDHTPVDYTNWAPGEPNNNRATSAYTRFRKMMEGGYAWTSEDGMRQVAHNSEDGMRQVARTSGDGMRQVAHNSEDGMRQVAHNSEDGMRQVARTSGDGMRHVAQSPLGVSQRRERILPPERLLLMDKAEDCIEMHNDFFKGQWNDALCSDKKPFVCQMPLDPSLPTPAPVLCSPPYASFTEYLKSCYMFVSRSANWQGALGYCKSKGATLVTIETFSEDSFVSALTKGSTASWIGLNSLKIHNQFLWANKLPVLYTNWADSQPDTATNTSRCVYLGEAWHTRSCIDQLPFVCKARQVPITTPGPVVGECPEGNWIDTGGHYCYYVETEKKEVWDGAHQACLRKSANMLSVHSQTEMDLVAKITSMHENLWIGLIRSRIRRWEWSDGTPYDYVNWALHEPSDINEMCVEMWRLREWNDNLCNVLRGYVCKVEKIIPGETKVVPSSRTTTVVTAPSTTTVVTSQSPTTVATSPRSPTTLHQQKLYKTEVQSGVGGGGAAGIVFACLVLAAAVVLVMYSYRRNAIRVTRPTERPPPSTSFDNVLYDPSNGPNGDPMAILTSEAPNPPEDTNPRLALIAAPQ